MRTVGLLTLPFSVPLATAIVMCTSCSATSPPALATVVNVATQTAATAPGPAAPIPTFVLGMDQAGSLTRAEQGDVIEVRLPLHTPATGDWRMLHPSGTGRVEPLGQSTRAADRTGIQRVFRFRAVTVGTLELVFGLALADETPRPERVVTFRLVIK